MNRPFAAGLALLISVFAFSQQPPAIGAKFSKKWEVPAEPTLCMTHPAQMDPCVDRVFGGVKYQVAYSQATHLVSYLYTSDEKFRTMDGLKVGDLIPVTPETVRALPGWQIFAPTTPDGWRPIVGYDLPQIKQRTGLC
jgi:hypothetical protein